jgi:arginase
VRVPRAWGKGGEAMAEAASLDLPYPEAAVVAEDSLEDQHLVLASELPERPLVLGGCCCSHVGAVEGLAARHDRLALIWIDAHGDLNTPETSPSGNEWGMPLRMIIDSGAVQSADVALLAARNLDPPEHVFIAESGLHAGDHAVDGALSDVDCVYVAIDFDGLDAAEVGAFMPEPGGLSVDDAERLLRDVASNATVVGAGLTGLVPDPRNLPQATRLTAALGL